jgi:shikimate dehydrogenase
MRVKFDTDTQLLFQIGDPLDHACACYIHNRLYDLANLNAINLNVVVKKGALSGFVQACKELNVRGFDITTPHKSDIISFCDEVESFSREFNCVNHVKIRNGRLIGVGLDGLGMRTAIEAADIEIKEASVMMLGAGAVSGPIAAELCKKGAGSVVILNRTIDKARSIAATLKKHFSIKVSADFMTVENIEKYSPSADLTVQCTNLGMSEYEEDYGDLRFVSMLPKTAAVADVIFNPEKTSLLKEAEKRGLKILNGMGMLVNQEKAMMKFHFDLDLGDEFAREGEEALRIALAMRQLRSERIAKGKEIKR